jgi:hypothetical protein
MRAELEQARERLAGLARLQEHQSSSFTSNWTAELKEAVEESNRKYPQYKIINDSYAFNAMDNSTPVTLDYLLWAIGKTMRKGAHPLDALMAIGNTHHKAEAMISAYMAYLGAPGD